MNKPPELDRRGAMLVLLARRGVRDVRGRTVVAAYLFLVYALVQPIGYRHTYPSASERSGFAAAFGNNPGLRLLYGRPHAIDTVPGYTEWRVGGVLAIAAAVLGLFTAVRLLRAEEDAGRTETVLATAVSRGTLSAARALALAVSLGAAAVGELAGLLFGGLGVTGSVLMSVATLSAGAVGAGVGAVTSQLAGSRRGALGLGAVVVGIDVTLRALGDSVDSLRGLGWIGSLGWAERVQPLSGPRPAVLLLPVLATVGLIVMSARAAGRRDIGSGLLPARDRARPRTALLRSLPAQGLRERAPVLAVWGALTVALLFLFGVVSASISSAQIPADVQRQLDKLGTGSLSTARGYLAFLFLFFAVVTCLFAAAQAAALRAEETEHLETVLAQPVGRVRWLLGRIALAVGALLALAALAGLSAFAGTSAVGAGVGLADLLAAGLNTVPVAVLFLGVGVLGFAGWPRATAGLAYGLVVVSFLWQLVGALLSPPRWVLDLSPFAHVALVPTESFRVVPALVLVGVGALAATAGVLGFGRRDLRGS